MIRGNSIDEEKKLAVYEGREETNLNSVYTRIQGIALKE